MKFKLSKGFTLVELLIVIGLLGAIALIVIAAINPIEQANRARDSRFQADGGQLVSAIERYFASHSNFPWEDCSASGCTTSTDEEFGFLSAASEAVGLCGTDCNTQGLLITSDELKNEFLARDWLKSTAADSDKIQIGKAQGSSTSVYACYVPLSKSNRDKAIAGQKVHTLSFNTNGTVAVTTTACTAANSTAWTETPCYVCIPE